VNPSGPQSLPVEDQAFVALQRAADFFLRDLERLLKTRRLSPAQYNVLRILRGAGSEGLACRAIAARMFTRDPDITRILDRLDAGGLISRERPASDRRVVRARITPLGLKLLHDMDPLVRETHRWQFRRVPAARLRALVAFLNKLCSS
jgi:DNA-binding MarR family transcriptional regulator